MANCEATPEVKRILRAMAKAQLEAGVTDAHEIVDAIHAAIAEHTPLWKGEIAEIVGGFGEKAKATKSELQERLSQLRKDLKASYGGKPPSPAEMYRPTKTPRDPEAVRNATRQNAIRKEIAKIDEKIRTGDFSKKTREPPIYSAETQKLQAELERARAKADRAVRQFEYKNQSRLYKAVTAVQGLMRAAILSGTSVFEHLAGASGWRLFSTLAEDASGAALRVIPSYRELEALAPVEGGGFNAASHVAGIKGALSKQTLRDMRDKLVKGASDRQILYGKKGEHELGHGGLLLFPKTREKLDVFNYPLLDLVGHVHDAIKTPIENYAFARAYSRGAKNLREKLARQGKTADEADKVLATDSAQAMLTARAYEESQAAKLQGKNAVVDRVNQLLREADRSGDIGTAVAAIVRYQMPIMKIPANLASEVFSYAIGGAKAASKYRGATRMGERLTPEAADYIVRNLKKQTIGAGLLALGWFGADYFGGLYRPGHGKGEEGGVKPTDFRAGDFELSHHWTHSAFWNVMQASATARHVYDEDLEKAYGSAVRASKLRKKIADNGGTDKQRAELERLTTEAIKTEPLRRALDGFAQATGAIVRDLPFAEAPESIMEAAEGGKKLQKFIGSGLRQFVPAEVQAYAKRNDLNAKGEPTYRKPRSVLEEIQLGIPGHGIGPIPGRLDVPSGE